MSAARNVLVYEYVPDMAERRGPHREAHLARIGEWFGDGRIMIAGATGDPPSGALIVFAEGADPEEFAAGDPYVQAGLVTARRVEPYAVVT
jgi:uncharacterized protein YciI